jgi:hypothetical protein
MFNNVLGYRYVAGYVAQVSQILAQNHGIYYWLVWSRVFLGNNAYHVRACPLDTGCAKFAA